MVRAIVLLVVLAACACGVIAHSDIGASMFVNPHRAPSAFDASCPVSFQIGGARFNVSELQLPLGGYIANNTIDNFFYCINICANVNSERNCICNPCGDVQYPAQQVQRGDVCVAYLGQLNAATWSLLDPARPQVGLLLVYDHGSANATMPGGSDAPRSSRVTLKCDPSAPFPSTLPQFAGESPARVFNFNWATAAACPL